MYFTKLYCILLNCTALHITLLPWTALHFTALLCTALPCTALTALYCSAVQCSALHCTALYCTALHCTALHYIWLHCTAACGRRNVGLIYECSAHSGRAAGAAFSYTLLDSYTFCYTFLHFPTLSYTVHSPTTCVSKFTEKRATNITWLIQQDFGLYKKISWKQCFPMKIAQNLILSSCKF